ncbi:hypothetical protein ACFYM2_09030 [Streptomyces sp. NPDC006711]|uniref:hypothetical protein n=1 Tax=unclassified Streptomyces TaxID=2593676 RepID=UPI0033E66704
MQCPRSGPDAAERPSVAVVAPLTGPRTAWGTVLLGEVDRARASCPDVAEWCVHDESPGVAESVARAGYTAVLGHCDTLGTRRALSVYESVGLPCLLPFVPAAPPALSWAPDEDALVRTLVAAASALGAAELSAAHDEGPEWAALVRRVETAAARAGLTGHSTGAPAVLASQRRVAQLPAGEGPVLVPLDCGLSSFTALASEAGSDRQVWAVHPQMCAARRARTAVTALAQTLTAAPTLRGAALTEAVRARSGALLTTAGGVLGDGWRVSRLGSVCPARGEV